jgi:hypothetical protein
MALSSKPGYPNFMRELSLQEFKKLVSESLHRPYVVK